MDVTILDKENIQKFYEFSLQKYVDNHADEISCCPTPDCKYAFVRDDDEEDTAFKCPMCKKT